MALYENFDESKMMLCPYDKEEFNIIFPSDVLTKLKNITKKNVTIRDFFIKNRSSEKTNEVFFKMFEDFVNRYEESVKICCQCYSSRSVYRTFHIKNSFFPTFYHEYFTEYGNYLLKMREVLKNYSEFLDDMEIKINEWAKSKNIEGLDSIKPEIPNQEKIYSCLVF